MKKRIIGVLLAILTIVGTIPSIVMADMEIIRFEDPVDPSDSGDDILKLIEKAAPAVPAGAITPYGTGSTITLLEKSELYTFTPGTGGKITYKGGANLSLTRKSPAADLRFTKAVAFDPMGCGRKNHIAFIGFKPANDKYSKGTADVYIYNMDTDTLVKSYSYHSIFLNWMMDSLDTVDANNYLSITAGDFNGNGRESIVFYAGHVTIVKTEGNNYADGLFEVSFDGENWNSTNVQVNRSGNQYLNLAYLSYCFDRYTGYAGSLHTSSKVENRLGVSLAAGDLNGDGIDDLVVLSSTGNLTDEYRKYGAYDACVPLVAVGEGKAGTSSINELKVKRTTAEFTYPNGNREVPAAPDVSIGDIDGDGNNEIIVAGFTAIVNSNGRSLTIDTSKSNASIKYIMYKYNGMVMQIGANELFAHSNSISPISYGDSVRKNESSWQQCSVECVNFDGLHTKSYVFINGYVYQASKNNYGLYTLTLASGSDNLNVTGNQSDTNFGFNFLVTSCYGVDVNEVFIRSAAVGNMRRSNSGRECIELIVGFKRNDGKGYYYQSVCLAKTNKGEFVRYIPGYFYADSSTARTDSNSGFAIAAVDIKDDRVPDDTISVRYNTTISAYTDPNVVAFLQAAPYFSEFGAGNSSTAYSYSESYTRTTSHGKEKSYGLGITAGFETPAIKTEIEATITSSISEEFSESRTTEFTTTFEANDQNQVIIRRTLMYLYCYDVVTGVNADGTPIYEPCSLVISVPQYPVMTSLSMEQYDEFAKAYNAKYGAGVEGSESYYLDIISKDNGALMNKYFLNNEGNPFAYASDVSQYREGFKMTNNGNWMELSHANGVSSLEYSTSIATEKTRTVSDGASLNVSLSVGGSFAGFGASAGITSSMSSLSSTGLSTAQMTSTETSGTVQNLSGDDYKYTFSWTLIGWKTESKDGLFSGVPFVGYAVRNVSAPIAKVNDLRVEYGDTPGTATLVWSYPEHVKERVEVAYFEVFKIDGQKRISLGNTSSTFYGVKSYGVTATYVVVCLDETKRQRSADSNEVQVIFAITNSQVQKILDEKTEELKNAMSSGQDAAIAKVIQELTEAYKKADEAVKAGASEDLEALKDSLAKADQALQDSIDAVEKKLDDAIVNLTKLVNDGDKANSDALLSAVDELTKAYEAADALLKSDIEDLSDKLNALDEKLTKADQALQDSIDAVEKKLDDAIVNLTKLVNDGDKANSDALLSAVDELTKAYKSADSLLKSDIDDLSGKLDALDKKMNEADDALQKSIDAVQKNLDRAIEELNKAIANGDAVGSEKLATAIDELKKAYQAADELIKSDIKGLSDRLDALESALKQADEALKNDLDQTKDSLAREMEELKKEMKAMKEQLEAQDRDNMDKVTSNSEKQQKELNTLKVVAISGLCISVLALVGDIALLIQCIQKRSGIKR